MNSSISRVKKLSSLHAAPRAVNTLVACVAAHGLGVAAHAASDGTELQASENERPMQLPAEVVGADRAPTITNSAKFTEPVTDIPQSITVIPPEVYQAQAAATLTDALRNTPGITLFAGEGGGANRTGGDSFYLRGFDTSNSIFVDGVREEGALVHDLFDVAQVDVFKGPSPENGRGGTAGYINLESKIPQAPPLTDITYTHGFGAHGSKASDRETLDLNVPLASTPLSGPALRLNFMDQQGGIPGRDYAENNRWGLAPSLAVGLDRASTLIVAYEHLHENNLPDYGLPATAVAGLAPAATPTAPSLFSPGVDPSSYYGFVSYDSEKADSDTAALLLEHVFGPGLKLNNQTRYGSNDRHVESTSPQGSATTPAGKFTLNHSIYDTHNAILSNQTNLAFTTDTGPVTHALTAGLDLSREISDNPTWAVVPLGVPNPNYLVGIYLPANFPRALPNYDPHPTGSATHTRIDTGALYAFDTAKVGSQWELTGGLRLERYAVDELSITAASPAIGASPAQPASVSAPATAATAAVARVAAASADLVAARTVASWKAGLVYKPNPEASLYLSSDSAVRPPGTSGATNTLSTAAASADNPLLQPERSENYEIGAKWGLFGGHLETTLALFLSETSHVPAADPVSGLVDQTSDQTVKGVEVGLSGHVSRGWLVFAGYAHMEPTVSDEISSNAQGLTLPLLPKDSANLWTTYALPHGLTLGGGFQYMGETERLQATSSPTPTTFSNGVPSYWLFSAMLSDAVTRHLTLRLNATNVLDKEYISSLNNNGYRVNLGARRTLLLSAEYQF